MASLIDFSLAPKITGSDYLGPLQAMQLGRQARADELKNERAQAQDQARQQALQQYTSGDKAGAQKTAVAAGDFDLATHLSSVDEGERKRISGMYDAIGRTAYGLKSVPLEQRQQVFDQRAAALAAQGIPPDLIAQARADLSDAALDGYATEALSVLDQIKRHDDQNKPVVLADGSELRRPDGSMVARNEPEARWIPVPQGGQLVQVGPNGAPVMGAQPGGGAPALTGADIERSAVGAIPGLRVTSGARTPEHNREVGGVPNSRHLTDQARDFVPPPGMSMGDLATRMRQALPGAKIINEGDHVHVEATGSAGGGGPNVINGRPKEKDAPSGYRWVGDTLQPIPGGPADAGGNTKETRRTEVTYRKEFDALPEVKSFKEARTQYLTLKGLATKPNPTGADDIALIFSYMKALDPSSVVREGEFKTAANSAGVVEAVGNRFQRAKNGQWLNPKQRREMLAAAGQSYLAFRQAYNQTAENYIGYARDAGVNPNNVAHKFADDKRPSQPATPVRVKSPAEAAKLKPGTLYAAPDGVVRRR